MYHEDRLGGGGFSRVVLAGASSRGRRTRASACAAISRSGSGRRVEPLDFRGAVALRDRIAAGPELLDSLAPSIGVILREQVA